MNRQTYGRTERRTDGRLTAAIRAVHIVHRAVKTYRLDIQLHLCVTCSCVNRLSGEYSISVGQNVISEWSVIAIVVVVVVVVVVIIFRHLRCRRSHLLGHVLSTRRKSASQHRARGRRWPRSYAVDHPDEASCSSPRCRSRPWLPAACFQLGAGNCRLPTVAGGRWSHAAVRCYCAGTRTSSIISIT